jgi:hypothetical protein
LRTLAARCRREIEQEQVGMWTRESFWPVFSVGEIMTCLRVSGCGRRKEAVGAGVSSKQARSSSSSSAAEDRPWEEAWNLHPPPSLAPELVGEGTPRASLCEFSLSGFNFLSGARSKVTGREMERTREEVLKVCGGKKV